MNIPTLTQIVKPGHQSPNQVKRKSRKPAPVLIEACVQIGSQAFKQQSRRELTAIGMFKH